MADNTLSNGGEGVSRKHFEDIVQTVNALFGQHPCHRRILSCQPFHVCHVHEIQRAVRQRLNEDRCRPGDKRGRTEQAAASHVAHGHLPPIARVHVHTNKPTNDDRDPFYICLGVDDSASQDIDQRATGRETLRGGRRHRTARTVAQQRDGVVFRAVAGIDLRHENRLILESVARRSNLRTALNLINGTAARCPAVP